MILVDTSVWVDHLRQGEPLLVQALMQTQAATHPFVVGELACGNLKNRQTLIELLQALPPVKDGLINSTQTMAGSRRLQFLAFSAQCAQLSNDF